jgi:hypothetical protein
MKEEGSDETDLLLNGSLDSLDVGNGQVISDDLGLGVLGKVGPRLPVVLVERVLDRDDRVLGDHLVVLGGELLAGDPLRRVRVGILEVKVAAEEERGKGSVSESRKKKRGKRARGITHYLPSLKNSDEATSRAMEILPVKPAFSMASTRRSRDSVAPETLGANPPSSPTLVAEREVSVGDQ